MTKPLTRLATLALVGFFLAISPAGATEYNLTGVGSSEFDGVVKFTQVGPQPTGSGFIDSFVRIEGGGSIPVKEAYNTTVDNVFQNGATNTFNHALLLSQVPTVTIGGTAYREFILDINEAGSAATELLSVSDIQVFLSATGNQSTTNTNGTGLLQLKNASLVYRLDAGGDDSIKLNYSNNSGSGSGDMSMLIPDSLFQDILKTHPTYTQLVLYSKFGVPIEQNDGYEEWFVCNTGKDGAGSPVACTPGTTNGTTGNTQSPQVPEPASFALLGAGLVYLNRRRKK